MPALRIFRRMIESGAAGDDALAATAMNPRRPDSGIGPDLPPPEYHVRECLRCGRLARMPKSRRLCEKCFDATRQVRPGIYGLYGPGSVGLEERRRRE
jgi:hypothetical protein